MPKLKGEKINIPKIDTNIDIREPKIDLPNMNLNIEVPKIDIGGKLGGDIIY